MPNIIVHKLSNQMGSIPDLADLVVGELAINSADGKAFIKKTQNGVETIIEIGSGLGEPSQLELLTQNNQTGWRILDRNPINYGNIGSGAVDFSFSDSQSTLKGAIGQNSFAQGYNTIAQGIGSSAEGNSTSETVELRIPEIPIDIMDIQFLSTGSGTGPLDNELIHIFEQSHDVQGDPSSSIGALFVGNTDATGTAEIQLIEDDYLIVFPNLDDVSFTATTPYVNRTSESETWIEGVDHLSNGDRKYVYNVAVSEINLTFVTENTGQTSQAPIEAERVFIYDNSIVSPVGSGPGQTYPDESLALFSGTTSVTGTITAPISSGNYLILFPDMDEALEMPITPFVIEDHDVNIWKQAYTAVLDFDVIPVFTKDLPLADISFEYQKYSNIILLSNAQIDVYTYFGQFVDSGYTDANGRLQIVLPGGDDYLFKIPASAIPDLTWCPFAVNGWSYDDPSEIYFKTVTVPNTGVVLTERFLNIQCS